MKTIVKMIYGSHLYGTSDEESDRDYKGIFLPDKRDILLGQFEKSIGSNTKEIEDDRKNTSDDIDMEMYSLHYFIEMACEGQTGALDMLHAPDNMILETSDVWEDLVSKRERFYTSQIKAFVDYARKQASKYGIKGSRLNATQQVLDLLNKHDNKLKLKEIWEQLPLGDYQFMVKPDPNGYRQYQICDKKIQETAKIGYFKEMLNGFMDKYGHRAREASKNKNIDWKAISHAVRAAFEIKELFQDGTITIPLKDREIVYKIKRGKLDYSTEAAPLLEGIMEEVEELAKTTNLPKEVDVKFWEDWIVTTIEREYFKAGGNENECLYGQGIISNV